MRPEAIIGALLRHNSSSAMVRAARRFVIPLARMRNPELTDRVVTLLRERVLSTVKEIDSFQQEVAVAIGYLPVEFSTNPTRLAGLRAEWHYDRCCSTDRRVSIVARFHDGFMGQGSATLLINSSTRSPSGGFSAAEQRAMDRLALGYCSSWQGPLLLPDSVRRYRIPLVSEVHGVATRMYSVLARPEQ